MRRPAGLVRKVTIVDAGVTEKVWSTGVAAAQVVLPIWEARMVQEPTASSVTVATDTAQTAWLCELKLTSSPELAVAPTVKGALPMGRFANGLNAMVWRPCVTV